jgi:hypothetical protein
MTHEITKLIVAALAAFALMGCATQAEMNHSALMYDKHIAAVKAAVPVPIFQMTAQPGQVITLGGVEKFSVYNPSDSANKVPAPPATPNVGLEAAKLVKDGVLGFFGIRARLGEAVLNAVRPAADTETAREVLRMGDFFTETTTSK